MREKITQLQSKRRRGRERLFNYGAHGDEALRLYVDENKSMRQIGEALGYSEGTISRALRKLNAPLKPRGVGWTYADKEPRSIKGSSETCMSCGGPMKARDSRPTFVDIMGKRFEARRRNRRCPECDERITTLELPDTVILDLIEAAKGAAAPSAESLPGIQKALRELIFAALSAQQKLDGGS